MTWVQTQLWSKQGIGVQRSTRISLIQNCSVTPPFRVSGRWVGGSESGWVGQPKSREGQFNPPPPPVSLSKGLIGTNLDVVGATNQKSHRALANGGQARTSHTL